MKRVALRLASAVLAITICFGASARAHVPASYAPVATNTNTKVAAPAFTGVIIAVAVAFAVVYRAVTKGSATHSLESVDPVAQFDVTK
ncbi:MAG TPA: hypothetical protein VMG63_15545 [Terriglobia bacterium]|nr:hypothetical protein [Terriglobia bacterium]